MRGFGDFVPDVIEDKVEDGVEAVGDVVAALRPGQVCRGVVTSVADFGVFVDLGGGAGFITVPNLSWRRIDHPSQVVHVGQEVVGAVLSVDLAAVTRAAGAVAEEAAHRPRVVRRLAAFGSGGCGFRLGLSGSKAPVGGGKGAPVRPAGARERDGGRAPVDGIGSAPAPSQKDA
ncbi:MAG: S1 RNA-binding domain-containing protein [Streptomyces sp.]|nr:S1 RNA-binding domain-containing protein [Streptomyces sp.]